MDAIRPVSIDSVGHRQGKRRTGNPAQEYVADFELVAKRVLTDPKHHRIFQAYFLKQLDERFGIPHGQFFSYLGTIRAKLGQAFARLKPVPLLPDLYFSASRHTHDVRPFPVPEPRRLNGTPLRAPLAPKRKPALEAEAVIIEIPLVPAPEAIICPFAPEDTAAIARWIRTSFSEHRSFEWMARRLNLCTYRPLTVAHNGRYPEYAGR